MSKTKAYSYGLLWLCIVSYTMVYGQTNGLGSWNIINLKYNHTPKFSLFAEGQIRSLSFYNDFHYHEVKLGANFKVLPNLKASLAFGQYDTYASGGNFRTPKRLSEVRLWPQLVMLQDFWRLKVEQRYRAEFRFTNLGYRTRFRYRLGVSYPFGVQKRGYKPLQASVSTELFFTNIEPYFERNRAMVALNYKFTKTASLQVGYISQFDYKINDETGSQFLVLGLFFELNRKQPTTQTNEIDLKDN